MRFAAPACAFAQPAHQRIREFAFVARAPSEGGRPKLGDLTPQPSHVFLPSSTAPACALAQPEHQRFFHSAASPWCGVLSPHVSHFLLTTFAAPACAFAQPAHQRFLPSDGSPKFGCFSRQSSHLKGGSQRVREGSIGSGLSLS